MTQRAVEHYQEVADQHQLQLPRLLGSAGSELWYAPRVAVHTLNGNRSDDQSRLNPFYVAFSATLRPAMDFSVAVTKKAQPQGWADAPGRRTVPASPSPSAILQHLKPGKLATGHLFDFRLEPLAPDEVPDQEREKLDEARYNRVYRPAESSEEVYFLATAALGAGSRKGRVACIGLVYMPCDRNEWGAITSFPTAPRVLGVKVPENVLLGRSVLEDSRSIATVVQLHAANQPMLPGSFGSAQR